jgi:hypothetical protein
MKKYLIELSDILGDSGEVGAESPGGIKTSRM